jgi:hypothetical protein
MLMSALIHHVILVLIDISLIVNYWTTGTGIGKGKFLFLEDIDGKDEYLVLKLCIVLIGAIDFFVATWLFALGAFYTYLGMRGLTAYQYKENKKAKFGQVMDKQNAKNNSDGPLLDKKL